MRRLPALCAALLLPACVTLPPVAPGRPLHMDRFSRFDPVLIQDDRLVDLSTAEKELAAVDAAAAEWRTDQRLRGWGVAGWLGGACAVGVGLATVHDSRTTGWLVTAGGAGVAAAGLYGLEASIGHYEAAVAHYNDALGRTAAQVESTVGPRPWLSVAVTGRGGTQPVAGVQLTD